ncbi:MAG: DUF4175 family protein [Gammaproteobacteria bacterium]
MSARERLEQYLDRVRRRLRAAVVARASAVVALTALLVTVIAVWLLRDPGFPPAQVMAARVVLALSLVVAAAAMLWRPLLALQPRNRSKAFERNLPTQGGRIETYMELARRREQGEPAPLIDLLAEDALAVAEQAPPETAVPRRRLWVPAAVAAGAVAVLIGLMVFDRAGFGFGSRNLWFGATLPKEKITARSILVKPGDTTIRRNQDVPIHATMQGFTAQNAEVFVRFGDSKTYERAPMKASPSGEFEFTLYALREPLSYYVVSQGAKSTEHHIYVADVPRIERMRLTYNYPSWTGLAQETDESYRDIQAVAGTRVTVEVQTSAPLDSPTLKVNGAASDLKRDGNWSRGTLELTKAGTYRIHARVGDELVPLTDEYQISLVEDQKPTIEIAKPGRDWQASSIEEVPIRVHAKDDFRVQNVELHYSVNGGEWQVKPLDQGTTQGVDQGVNKGKEVTKSALMRLEDMGELQSKLGPEAHLTPGDIVTYYAVAKDRKQEVQTDLFIIHVQPFERRFTQGQAGGGGGGGGGGGDEQNAISQRQREILLATWNLQRLKDNSKGREAERVGDNARMLQELQSTLADQANTLVQRAQARGVDDADPKNKALIENLQQAVQAMSPAAKHLGDADFPQAIPSEQKALQHLLRAEALYSDIELQFRSAQGGGGGSQAGRDLAEMFELEMDLEKNQYETASRASKDESPQQLEDAIRKLRELARRQEQLARQQQNQQQKPRESDRWQQEQLKRETEELRKQLEQLAQQNAQQNGQQNANSRGSQGQGSGPGQSSNDPSAQGQSQGQGDNSQQNGGRESASQQAARMAANNALNEVKQALENMQRAAGNPQNPNGPQQQSPGTRSAQASRDLKQALEKMEQGRRDGAAGSFDDLAEQARRMVEEQRKQESEMLSAYSRPSETGPNSQDRSRGLSWERAEALAEKKRALAQELESLQRDMQASARAHKDDAPQAAENVGKASENLAESGLNGALTRSAMELERGRGIQAAGRERLVTQAMEALENDLGRAAQIASTESQQKQNGKEEATPEELLAELSELRRAWQLAQSEQQRLAAGGRDGRGPNGEPNPTNDPTRQRLASARSGQLQPGQLGQRNQPGSPGQQSGGNQPGQNPSDPNQSGQSGQSGQSQQGQGQQGQGQDGQSGSQGQQGGASGGSPQGGANGGGGGGAYANGGADYGARGGAWGGGPANGWYGGARPWNPGDRLANWNPPLPSSAIRPVDPEEYRRQAEAFARRLRELGDRLPQGALSDAEIAQLRQLSNRLRQATAGDRDRMDSEYAKMVGLVDQLELAALSASEKNKSATATRAARPAEDSPEYRETVAEYYRRLGNDGSK